MNTLPLSVIILGHQVGARLDAAIASVNWAAEVLVIWSGTTELFPRQVPSAVRIISAGSKVHDFAALRNQALQEAGYDWVFFLDSDEVFNEKTLRQLRSVIENPLIDGATIHRQDVFLQQELHHGEVGHVSILRLVRKQKAKYERKVHEHVVVKGHVARTSIQIYHFSHCSVADFLSKVIFYIQLEQIERAQFQQKFQLWEMLFFPPAKFIQNYFFRLGFLDGWRGMIYATMMSIHSFGVRASLYENT